MASLPVEILYGVYLGILVGIIPTLVSWMLGFVFKYLTGVTVPGFGVVVLAVAIAGANGGLLALADPTLTASENQVRFTVALLVVLMGSLYAHDRGDKFGANLPKRVTLKELTQRTLSADVIELVGGRGEVRVTVAGEVGDLEGYPPLPADLRAELTDQEWTFSADVPLDELETRVADRLRTDFDLADAVVQLDERGRASVSAAPPVGSLSKRVPAGRRAVSVPALLPTGLAHGDEVTVHTTDGEQFEGTVLGARAGPRPRTVAADEGTTPPDEAPAADGSPTPGTAGAPVSTGGEGRVTVAVDRRQAEALLGAEASRLVVRSRGTRNEYALVSLLRRAGKRFRRLSARQGGDLAGRTLGEASVRDAYGVVVLAVRHGGRWAIAPHGSQAVDAGDDLVVVGTREALDRFEGAVA